MSRRLPALIVLVWLVGVGCDPAASSRHSPRPATTHQIASFVARAEGGERGTYAATYRVILLPRPSAHRVSVSVVAAQVDDKAFSYEENGTGTRGNVTGSALYWWFDRTRKAHLYNARRGIYQCERVRRAWTCQNDDKLNGNGMSMLMAGYPEEGFVRGLTNAVQYYTRTYHELAYLVRSGRHAKVLSCLYFGKDYSRRHVCLDSHRLVAAYSIPLEASTNGTSYVNRPEFHDCSGHWVTASSLALF